MAAPEVTRWEPEWVEQLIALGDVIKLEAWQVRAKLDPGMTLRYQHKLEAGQVPPPIKVARVEGLLYLVDGWHRLEAREAARGVDHEETPEGREGVHAKVAEMSLPQAMWQAAVANDGHGLPLKKGDLVRRFDTFVRTDQYRKPSGQPMGYRDMGLILGAPRSTLHRWMTERHPKVAALMASEGAEKPARKSSAAEKLSRQLLRQGQGLLRDLRALAGAKEKLQPAALRRLEADLEATLAEWAGTEADDGWL